MDVGVGENAGGLGELGPVALDELAGADALRVDARFARQHAHDELLLGHLQGEHPHPAGFLLVLGPAADVGDDVEGEARLPHARPRREDDEVAGLKAAGEPVEIGEAGGNAGDLLLPLVERLDGLEGLGDDRLEMDEGIGGALLGDGEDAPLAFVGELAHLAMLLVAELGDGAGRLDQPARQRLLVDDLGVVDEVGGGGDDLVEQVDELVASDGVERAERGERVLDGDAIDRLTLAEEVGHRLEDLAVAVAVEVFGFDVLEDVGEGGAVEQDPAEKAALRIEVVRRDTSMGQGDDSGGSTQWHPRRRMTLTPDKRVNRNLGNLWRSTNLL